MYRRQLIMMISIIALSFTMLSTAFMLLSYRYMIQDERDDAARNVGYIANFTTSYLQQNTNIQTDFYRNYIASIALISDSMVLVADPQGQVVYATDGAYFYNYKDVTLPPRLVSDVFEKDLLKNDGILIFEHSKSLDFSTHPNFLRQRSYGSVQFSIFRK